MMSGDTTTTKTATEKKAGDVSDGFNIPVFAGFIEVARKYQ
jgi:hypothetical protein